MDTPVDLLKDFSDRWPAVVVKELRQGLRSPLFVLPFILLHVLALVALASEYADGRAAAAGTQTIARFTILRETGFFWSVTAILVAIIMPLRSFASLHDERRGGQSDLLLLGGLSRWQIVRGKWLVQMLFCALALVSLTPYLLVRYFFGGFDLISNGLTLLNVAGATSAMSACLIGASGYRSLTTRFFAVAVCSAWIIIATLMIQGVTAATGSIAGIPAYSIFCGHLFFALYTAAGLQLGRAHLKVYLLPFEVNPGSTILVLMIIFPFLILGCGLVLAAVSVWLVWIALVIPIAALLLSDNPWQPSHGRLPASISGFDTNWRPLH
jgi:hypothetical protein